MAKKVLVHAKAADLKEIPAFSSLELPAREILCSVPATETDEYIVRYEISSQTHKPVHGQLGYFSGFAGMGRWEEIADAPVFAEVLRALENKEHAIEDCGGIDFYDPCGCRTHRSWAHSNRDFQQSVGCTTCEDGFRGNPSEPDLYLCQEHYAQRYEEEETS